MNLTQRGTWAAVTFTVVLATAATAGLLIPALDASTTKGASLEATVSRALDAAEAGDAGPARDLDPDCGPITDAELAFASSLIKGWTFNMASVRYSSPEAATVTIVAMGPEDDEEIRDAVEFAKGPAGWSMVRDGSC